MAVLNFTGRREIDRSEIQIRVRQDDGRVMLDVLALGLHGLNLPATAEVAVEAYRQTTKERVSCGTVAAPTLPRNVHLATFDVSDNIQLRVRVVGNEGASRGKILAVADRLRGAAENNQDSEPLLKLQRSDLGDLIWKFDVDNGPLLLLNKRLQNHETIVNSIYFKALILPEFLRQVAVWVARNIEDSSDPNSTLSQWIAYMSSIGVEFSILDDLESDDPSYNDMIETWASEAASAFASQLNTLGLINSAVLGEEEGDERD